MGKDVKSIKNTWFFLVYCSFLELFCTETKDGQLLNKPQTRQLLKNPGGAFLQIQTDVNLTSIESTRVIKLNDNL